MCAGPWIQCPIWSPTIPHLFPLFFSDFSTILLLFYIQHSHNFHIWKCTPDPENSAQHHHQQWAPLLSSLMHPMLMACHLGNLASGVHNTVQQAHHNAVAPAAFLVIPKGECTLQLHFFDPTELHVSLGDWKYDNDPLSKVQMPTISWLNCHHIEDIATGNANASYLSLSWWTFLPCHIWSWHIHCWLSWARISCRDCPKLVFKVSSYFLAFI